MAQSERMHNSSDMQVNLHFIVCTKWRLLGLDWISCVQVVWANGTTWPSELGERGSAQVLRTHRLVHNRGDVIAPALPKFVSLRTAETTPGTNQFSSDACRRGQESPVVGHTGELYCVSRA
eukprot:m.182208 g.182208  ORF g.182208 m.182208 type:complete len:121 (+) comp18458_c1_seq3:1818-2180(+)